MSLLQLCMTYIRDLYYNSKPVLCLTFVKILYTLIYLKNFQQVSLAYIVQICSTIANFFDGQNTLRTF